MIYVNAETAEEIAQSLRGTHREMGERQRAALCADRLLGKKKTSGTVVEAPRQSGKTTELLRYAEETNPDGQFIVACMNHGIQQYIGLLYWRLSGEPVISPSPPLMVTPDNYKAVLQGRPTKLIFVDEWNSLPFEMTNYILESGLFVAAVTS